MKILDLDIKVAMLQVIADKINPASGGKNHFIFKRADDTVLSEMAFDTVTIEDYTTSSPYITFTVNGTVNLEGIASATGRVETFSLFEAADPNNEVISGTAGMPSDISADIKFNRVDWVKKNGIELSNVIIRLENVCLLK